MAEEEDMVPARLLTEARDEAAAAEAVIADLTAWGLDFFGDLRWRDQGTDDIDGLRSEKGLLPADILAAAPRTALETHDAEITQIAAMHEASASSAREFWQRVEALSLLIEEAKEVADSFGFSNYEETNKAAGAQAVAAVLSRAGDLSTVLAEVKSDAWDEGAEQTTEWMANNPGPTGIPHDPPANPYRTEQGGADHA